MAHVTVYRIDTHTLGGNTHTCSLSEQWEVTKDSVHPTEEQAIKYVRNKNRSLWYFRSIMINLSEEECVAFMETVDSNPLYYHHVRYFVNPPDKDRMIQSMKTNGIDVVMV